MDAATRQRLWGYDHALDTPFVRGFLAGLAGILITVPLCLWLLQATGQISPERQRELWARYRS
jgi:hypothetical protein